MKKHTYLLLLLMFWATLGTAQTFQWVKDIGGSGDDYCKAIKVDGNDDIIVTGIFTDSIDIDPGPAVDMRYAPGGRDIFVAKLSPAGNLIWAKTIGGATNEEPWDVAVDAANNIIITGLFQGTVDFDPGPSTYLLTEPNGLPNIFYWKLDNAGQFLWAKSAGGTGTELGRVIAVDGSGNIFVGGNFTYTADFDPGPNTYSLTAAGTTMPDGFVTKLDPSGNFLWAIRIGNAEYDVVYDLDVDAAGNVLFCSNFKFNVDFDPGPGVFNLTSVGGSDMYITKLNAQGNFQWVKQVGGAGHDTATQLHIGPDGSIYYGSQFQFTVDFDPGPGTFNLISSSSYNLGFSKLDSAGSLVWAKAFISSSGIQTAAIEIDTAGNFCMMGHFQGTADFDPSNGVNNLTALDLFDVYLFKMNAQGNSFWVGTFSGQQTQYAMSMSIDRNNNIYTAGYFNLPTDFDPGPGLYNMNPLGSYDGFVHKFGNCIGPNAPTNTTSLDAMTICEGSSTTLSVAANGDIFWYAVPTGGIPLGSGAMFTTPPLTVTTTYYVESSTCAASPRIPITVTVVQPSSGTLSPSACGSYVSPSGMAVWTNSGTYYDTLVNAAGCDSLITIVLTIYHVDTSILNAAPTLTANAIGATYQWIYCDSAMIPGATNASFTATENGSYAVVVTQNGCTDTSACIAITGIVGLEYGMPAFPWVQPNPTNGGLNVHWEEMDEVCALEVLNALGQRVAILPTAAENGAYLELKGSDGIYFLVLHDRNGNRKIFRVLKQN